MSFSVPRNRLLKLCSACLLLFLAVTGCTRKTEHPAGTIVADPATAGTLGERSLPELSEDATLEDYLRYAALSNAGLQSAFNNWRAELERIPQVSSLPDPRFTYKHFIEEIETRVGPQRYSVGVSQMFPWFGKLELRGNVALEAANIAQQKYEAVKRRLFFRVESAYYEYYFLGQAIAIVNEHHKLVKALEKVVRDRYKTDLASYLDLIRLQVELGKLEDRLSSLKDMVEPRVARLNAALNRSINAELPLPGAIPVRKLVAADEEIERLFRENNPKLAALEHAVAKAKYAIELAGKDYYPDIMLGLDYVVTEEALMPDVKDSGKDPVVAMISVSLPIWREKYRARVTEAKFQYASARKALAEIENTLSADLKLALYNYRDSERKIDLYRDTLVPKASQSLAATQRAFVTAKVGFLDVIDALRTLLEFKLLHERSLTDRGKSISEIEMIVGKGVAESEKTSFDSDDTGDSD